MMNARITYETLEMAIAAVTGAGTNYRFVFFGDSVLHMASLNAFLMMHAANADPLSGIVVNTIAPGKRPQFSSADIFSMAGADIAYLEQGVDFKAMTVGGLKEKLDKNLAFGRQLERDAGEMTSTGGGDARFLIYQAMDSPPAEYYLVARRVLHAPLTFVPVEEGVGTYTNARKTVRDRACSVETSARRRIRLMVNYYMNEVASRYRQNKMARSAHVDPYTLYSKRNTGLKINHDYAKWTRKAFQAIGVAHDLQTVALGGKVLLLGTDAFVEGGEHELELRVLGRVVDAARTKGLDCVMKPHPRAADGARYDALDIQVVDWGNVPAEAAIAVSRQKPAAIVGPCSSTEMLAKELWEIPCFSLTDLLKEEQENYPSSVLLKAFLASCNRFEVSLPKCFLPWARFLSMDFANR